MESNSRTASPNRWSSVLGNKKPDFPDSTTSLMPPASLPSTSNPQAIASSSAFGSPSHRDGCRKTSQRRRCRAISEGTSRWPVMIRRLKSSGDCAANVASAGWSRERTSPITRRQAGRCRRTSQNAVSIWLMPFFCLSSPEKPNTNSLSRIPSFSRRSASGRPG